MVISKTIRIISIVILLSFVNLTHAALIGKSPTVVNGDLYPYTQTIIDGVDSFDVQMDGTLAGDPNTHLYVSTAFDGIGIMKTPDPNSSGNGDYRQINSDEVIYMTFSNIPSGKLVEISALSGSSSYFDPGMELYLSKNGELVETINCDGSGYYLIFPPIQAGNGDTVSLNPSGPIRLTDFTASLINSSSTNEPYISDSTDTSTILNQTISEPGHYYVTADWSGLTHKPSGVTAKVSDAVLGQFRFMGEMGPDVESLDLDLCVLNPGDTVEVLGGLTGAGGEDPGLWTVTLTKYDSWSGSRYSVPVVPLALASPLSGLDIQQDVWPKNSGFRNDYRGILGITSFENYVAEAMGHAPKCYAEELSSSWKNLALMDSYAQSHPDWQAMVHWNGKSIKLFYDVFPEKLIEFKPYHFRYNVGSYLSSAINASDTQIMVDDAGNFTVDTEAIIIPVDPTTGERRFDDAEMVSVTAISGNQLTVIRNAYEDKITYVSAGNFAAGSYIAPGSQSAGGGARYNYALNAPVDALGRNGADMVAEMLSHEFASGNALDRFHGIMFDVIPGSADSSDDCDLDGSADGGLDPRGIELFRLGVQSFARKLRAALPDRIFTYDGQGQGSPALQTVFNGIESEGFCHHHDSYTIRWSEAPNYYLFTSRWNQSAYVYNFCVPKQNDDPPVEESRPLRRFHMAGLVAMRVVLSHSTVEDGSGTLHALDEIRDGVSGTFQWLGAPAGELIRPGLSAADELGGAGLGASGWSCPDGSATVRDDLEGLLVEPVDTGADHVMVIEFSGISIPEGDLLIRFEGKGGLPHLPSDTARYISVEVDGRVSNGLTYDTLTGVVNNDGFTEVTAYFRSAGAAGGSTVTLRLIIESAADLTLRNFTIHNATDTLLREFENGIVLCNPSENPYTFDLANYFPGKSYVRIQGQSYDDPITNDGSAVGSTVQLDGYRGLFLRRVVPPCGDPPGDFNDDCEFNLLDFEMMADNWLESVFTRCSECDINDDGDINMEDYSILSQYWLN